MSPKPQRLSVLVAEDNPVMQTVVKFMLTSWGYDPILTVDGRDAWQILQRDAAPRLALMDWMMPGMEGVEICRQVRAAGREPYTYIVLLSARDSGADLVKAMDAGADDYLRKPFDAQELRVRLKAGQRIIQLQEQLLTARENLREQARRDPITGLLNHAAILATLDGELETAGAASVAILLADLDRFRRINDTFGRPAGDAVLREFALRVQAALPPAATVGRYGGGEVLIVLPGFDAAAAQPLVARIVDAIATERFNIGAASFPVTCSVGLASSDTTGGPDASGLLRSADESLFWARRDGRNQVAAAG